MGKPVETSRVLVLLSQTLAHALIFAAPSAGNFAERALLARETAILRELGTTPATDLRASPYSPN